MLEASEAALADSSLAYRELHDFNRQRMLRKLLEDRDLATLVVVTDTLKTAADTFRTVAGDPPADATMKQRALVGKMIERMSAAIAAPEPDHALIEWLNEHAILSADFETVTLRFDLASTEVGFYGHVREVITTAAGQQQDRESGTIQEPQGGHNMAFKQRNQLELLAILNAGGSLSFVATGKSQLELLALAGAAQKAGGQLTLAGLSSGNQLELLALVRAGGKHLILAD